MHVRVTLFAKEDDEEKGYIDYDEVEDWENYKTAGEIFRCAQREYGRCQSKIYIANRILDAVQQLLAARGSMPVPD